MCVRQQGPRCHITQTLLSYSYAAGDQFGQCKMMQKNNTQNDPNLVNGYSSDSTQRELANENQHDRVKMFFQKSLRPCALDEIIFRCHPLWVDGTPVC